MYDAERVREVYPSSKSSDPLWMQIHQYRSGLGLFNSRAPEDDQAKDEFARQTYLTPRQALEVWAQPAQDREAALFALRLAIDADREGDYALVGPMLRAAYRYFESDG